VSDLLISTVDLTGSAKSVPVLIELVDSTGRKVAGTITDSGASVIAAVEVRTDSDGEATVYLIPSADITPPNTYYAVRIKGAMWLIEKGEGEETILDALAGDLEPLAPAALAAHIADPTAAHDGTAISWTDNGDYGFSADNVSDAILELIGATLALFELTVRSDGSITLVVSLTQAAYDDLTPDANTLYVIVG
jgi:hypothetical protein